VGEDQKQHLELARDIAQKFNTDFSAPDFLPLPEPFITGPGTRVMSLRDGTKKMSKSDESDLSRINLADDADAVAQKIRKAKTDPHPLPGNVEELAQRPEAENLVNIYAGLSDQSAENVITEFAGAQFSTFKNALADLAVAKLTPIGAAIRRYLSDRAELDRVLSSGAARARVIVEPVMREIRRLVGFVG
jgi:tryptophanyl-tRNA synthetase